MSDRHIPSANPSHSSSGIEGISLGAGMAAAGAVAWLLPEIIDAESWRGPAHALAWALFTIGAMGVLIELERATARPGYGEVGVAVVLWSIGAAGLRLARATFGGAVASVVGGLSALLLIFGVIGFFLGLGKLVEPRNRSTDRQKVRRRHGAAEPQTAIRERWSLLIAAAQLVAAVAALFLR